MTRHGVHLALACMLMHTCSNSYLVKFYTQAFTLSQFAQMHVTWVAKLESIRNAIFNVFPLVTAIHVPSFLLSCKLCKISFSDQQKDAETTEESHEKNKDVEKGLQPESETSANGKDVATSGEGGHNAAGDQSGDKQTTGIFSIIFLFSFLSSTFSFHCS